MSVLLIDVMLVPNLLQSVKSLGKLFLIISCDGYDKRVDYRHRCNERIGKAAVYMQSRRLAKAIKLMKDDENLLRWNEDMWRTK